MVASIMLGSALLMLVRIGGMTGDAALDFHWRWTPTPEQRLLAQSSTEPVPPAVPPAPTEPPEKPTPKPAAEPTTGASPVPVAKAPDKAPASATAEVPDKRVPLKASEEPPARAAAPVVSKTIVEWPGFRGPSRDDVVSGVRIETNWSQSRPVEMWRRKIGPGWSSFAVDGNLLYTQEQRGDDEIVSCYDLTTGEPVWRHRDPARFWEANAGAGPRATPTLRAAVSTRSARPGS